MPENRNIFLSKYNTVYFFVPKIASSSLKKMCSTILGINQDSGFHKIDFPSIPRNSLHKKDKYFKFAFVRNPFDRLVSCYFGKVERRRGFASNDLWKNKTFDDFIRIICKISDADMDVHFKPQYLSLIDKNGELLVNFIGKFENISEDIKKVIKIAGFSKDIKLSHRAKSSHEQYRQYYTEESKNLVINRYKKDIEMFEYSF